jgi:hypothetical protein
MDRQFPRHELRFSVLTKQINDLLELRQNGQLTKSAAQTWLNSLPETQRADAIYELEEALSEKIDELPE